jgi:hypothetical protein
MLSVLWHPSVDRIHTSAGFFCRKDGFGYVFAEGADVYGKLHGMLISNCHGHFDLTTPRRSL